MPTKKWTEEEEEFLRANYMDMSNAELAEKFDITKNAVQKKLARMGLKRSEPVDSPPDEVTDTDTAIEEEPEVVSTESYFSSGNRFFYGDRDYKKAIEQYQQAIERESDDLIKLKALYWTAEAHAKLGQIQEAMSIFKEIAEEHGDHYLGDSAKRRAESLQEYML